MEDKQILLDNIGKLHTTEMGQDRIRRNLGLGAVDAVSFCKDRILDGRCKIYRQGKNCYCEIDDMRITVNTHSYTIITAHKENKNR
ncbi:MAG: DUF3781 domain-containing protein [Treponema sp.]|nr:DUF3781 domain-containing protein [Treponema sp.]